ncbi:unnamed protein product, partial [Adineta steineri]
EDIQRKRIDNILLKAYITLPPPYRAQMAKTGVLDKIVKFLEDQLTMHEEITEAFRTHHIYIPADYHTGMIQDGLFESLAEIVHGVDHENDVWRIRSLTRPNNQKRKSHRDDDDNDEQNRKKQKSKEDDNDDTADNNTNNIN